MDFSNIAKLIEEIERLKKAYLLLKCVHLEIGPYGDNSVEDKTRYDINDYFNFDDSE